MTCDNIEAEGMIMDSSALHVKTEKKHWYLLDSIKGVLVILVFVGHLIPGSLSEMLPRDIIYSFHMPVFIVLTGFLFRPEKQPPRFRGFAKKYASRLIVPWAIAMVLYFLVIQGIIRQFITWEVVLRYLYYPYYHLWYIVGIIGYLLTSYLIWKLPVSDKTKWCVMFSLAVVMALLTKFQAMKLVSSDAAFLEVIRVIRRDFNPFNYIYFVFGMFIRYMYEQGKYTARLKFAPLLWAVSGVLLALDIVGFYTHSGVLDKISYILLGLPLSLALIDLAVFGKSDKRCRWLEFLGQYSLPIYLYHVFAIILAENVTTRGSVSYFLTGIAGFVVICLLVLWLKRYPFVNKYFFGSTNSFLKNK